jgi:large subunit ribosomal protein L9e
VRDFKHLSIDITKNGNEITFDMWFGSRKQLACVRTCASHVTNAITGVQWGFKYKMRFVYNHYPINVNLDGQTVEIRNFLGQKNVFKVTAPASVKLIRSGDVKDQLELEGNDIMEVSLVAAKLQQATLIKHKDIRKFLDGLYVTESGDMAPSE